MNPPPFKRPSERVEVPPRDSVLARHDRRTVMEERLHPVGDFPRLVGLETDDHVILGTDLAGVFGGKDRDRVAPPGAVETEPPCPDGVQMGSARDRGYGYAVNAGEPNGKIAADGSCAVDTDLHESPPRS